MNTGNAMLASSKALFESSSLSSRLMFGLAASVVGLAVANDAYAIPQGAQVVHGNVVMNQNGNTLTIDQGTNKAITNWHGGFDINANEAVRINQPGATSISLNRDLKNDPTQILGQLSSNGRVMIINGSGVFFGPGARGRFRPRRQHRGYHRPEFHRGQL